MVITDKDIKADSDEASIKYGLKTNLQYLILNYAETLRRICLQEVGKEHIAS